MLTLHGTSRAPMYTLSFQREDPTSVGSNAGVMTIGGLPSGISNDSLTWVPVKNYPASVLFGDLGVDQAVVAAATKIFPSTPFLWEAVIDGFYVNGKLQANSSVDTNLTNQVGLTALFDSVSQVEVFCHHSWLICVMWMVFREPHRQ